MPEVSAFHTGFPAELRAREGKATDQADQVRVHDTAAALMATKSQYNP